MRIEWLHYKREIIQWQTKICIRATNHAIDEDLHFCRVYRRLRCKTDLHFE